MKFVFTVAENEDFVAGRVRGQSMRVDEDTQKERSQFGEAVNDWRSPNTAGHVSLSPRVGDEHEGAEHGHDDDNDDNSNDVRVAA